ncbi:MAG: hypothetical protein AAGH41_01950 [Pseudomonadota bacterium]
MEFVKRDAAPYLCVVSCGTTQEAWPIEIGWCFGGGEIRTMLIKPQSAWSLAAWDKGTEAQHRISVEDLLQTGKDALDACLVLNAALGGSEVQSASPEKDSLWLYKLYRVANVEPNFRIVHAPISVRDTPTRAAAGLEVLRQESGVAQTG